MQGPIEESDAGSQPKGRALGANADDDSGLRASNVGADDATEIRSGSAIIEEVANSGGSPESRVVPDQVSDATASYRYPVDESSSLFHGEDERTRVSRKPVLAPEDYFQSVPLAELAGLLEGKRLDHFQVEKMIGGGGMGAVFRGVDMRLNRTVAIKVIPASKRDPETLRRFRLEAQSAARLDHPNIARVYYIGEAEQWNYIVFEFVDGVNIRDLVMTGGPRSIDDTIFYTRQVAEALAHAYQRGVVHRDIKPSNLLVTETGVIKVVDMGLARNAGIEKSTNDATASGVTLGTFDYISPEQARNPREADVRSDLYSLGCSMFFMLTGQPPFSEGTVLQKLLKHGSVPPPDPRAWREDISDQVHAILMKLMAKQPAERYQTPNDLVSDLLLLAEVEDLPRSQLPGAVFLSPAAAQRSLLEANLPWLVALAFLLGSTLWLLTVQGQTGGYELVRLRDDIGLRSTGQVRRAEAESGTKEENSPSGRSSSATGNGENENSERASTNDLGGSTSPDNQVVYCSSFLPADVPALSWVASLPEAIKKAELIDNATIEVRGVMDLDERLELIGVELTIRGASGTKPRIRFSPKLVRELQSGDSAMQLTRSSIVLKDLSIEMDAAQIRSLPAQSKVGMLGLSGDGGIDFQNCEITLEDSTRARQPASLPDPLNLGVVRRSPTSQPLPPARSGLETLLDRKLGESYYAAPAAACVVLLDESPFIGFEAVPFGFQREDYRDFEVTVANSLIRGYGTFAELKTDLSAANSLELSFTGSLFAISGWVLNVENILTVSTSQLDRSLRLFCRSSTFSSGAGFARVKYQDVSQPLLGINRDSERCIYVSNAGRPHLSVEGLGQENMLSTLDRYFLRGSDNAYDSGIQILTRCLDADGFEVFSFGLNNASQNGWFAERVNERQVRWETGEPLDDRLLSEVTRDQFRVDSDRFVRGFEGAESPTQSDGY
jgi:serine/threonine protein kinase